jgi:hypothetical protein
MIIASTCFPHKDIHKITWTSPDGNTSNQVDHALIETRTASNILHVRSYWGANCNSDHYLVQIKYRGQITTRINKNNTCRHKDKLQTNRLKHPVVKNELQQKLEETRQSPGEENLGKGSTEEEWLEHKKQFMENI